MEMQQAGRPGGYEEQGQLNKESAGSAVPAVTGYPVGGGATDPWTNYQPNAPNAVSVVAVVNVHSRGPLITRQSGAALGLMLVAQILGLVVTNHYTRAFSTPGQSVLVCSETTGACTNHYFDKGWCQPGTVVYRGGGAYGGYPMPVEVGIGMEADSSGGSSGAQAQASSCGPYALGQACITDTNLAQCQRCVERYGNADRLVVMESCPLQFSCDTSAPPPPTSAMGAPTEVTSVDAEEPQADVAVSKLAAPPSGGWSDQSGCPDDEDSTYGTCEELPCPEGYYNPDAVMAQGIVIALLFVAAVGLMAAFPGACTCCQPGEGCSGSTTARIVTYSASLVCTALTAFIGLSLGMMMHHGGVGDMPPGVFAVMVVWCPLAAFGGITFARCISLTKERAPAPGAQDPAANNERHCIGISIVALILVVLAPFVVRRSMGHGSGDESGGGVVGGYGYGGCGSGPPRCQLATTVQMWDCGCESPTDLAMGAPECESCPSTGSSGEPSLLRTLGAGGTAPDGAVSRAVSAWLYQGMDAPEPRSAVSQGGIDAMYPWLNPTCANIGVHRGSAYCSNDPDFLLRRNTVSSPIPSQVPRDCVAWNDGCNTCSIITAGGSGGDETMACSLMACQSYDVPFCSEYADGKVCGSSRDPGCDPSLHPGRIDHTDPQVQSELLNMVTSWIGQCPTANAATCTPTESRVECVVWEPEIACAVMGRPFLAAHQALQASARCEVGSDWIGASP